MELKSARVTREIYLLLISCNGIELLPRILVTELRISLISRHLSNNIELQKVVWDHLANTDNFRKVNYAIGNEISIIF